MTQENIQSVRSDAEAALNNNHIPTFEEVYAMPYVQESIQAIIDQNIRQYPLLESYKDDLVQEMLIILNDALPKYDGRAGIEAFCRTCLENGMKMARRQYFQERNLHISFARDIDDFENFDDDSSDVSLTDMRVYASSCRNSVDEYILQKEITKAVEELPGELRPVAKWLLDGYSLRDIERRTGISYTTLRRKYLLPIRKNFSENFFKKVAKK